MFGNIVHAPRREGNKQLRIPSWNDDLCKEIVVWIEDTYPHTIHTFLLAIPWLNIVRVISLYFSIWWQLNFISARNINVKTLSLCLLSILITKRKESVTTGWTVACITLLSFLKLRCSHRKEPNRSEERSILSISRFILINPWFPLYRFAHLLYMYIFLPIWL